MNKLLQAIRQVRSGLGHRSMRLGLAAVLVASAGAMSVAQAQTPEPEVGVLPQGVVVHACPDTFETDDFQSLAQPIVAGTPQPRNFDGNLNVGVPDQDWVKFDVVRDGVYTMTTSSLSSLTDTFIKLYSVSGSPVMSGTLPVENDDSGATDFGSRIVWTAPKEGTYYLRIDNQAQSASAYEDCVSTQVRYTLSLVSQEPTTKYLYLPLIQRGP